MVAALQIIILRKLLNFFSMGRAMDSEFAGGGDELIARVLHGGVKKRRFHDFQKLFVKIPGIVGVLEF